MGFCPPSIRAVRGASIQTRQNENLFFWGKGFFVLPRLISRPQGVGGAGKKWKGKFLVLVPPLHSSRKDLYVYFSIVAIFCPSFPSSFASVRGAPISAFGGNSSVRSHFATTSHWPFAFAHDACSVFAPCSLCGFA